MKIGFFLLLISILRLSAAPQPSALFSDHAVLQRGVKVPVWGHAEPGEKIRVSYRGITAETTTDAGGRWCAPLPSLDVGPGGDLIIEGSTLLTFRDVIVGDVWFCSGQSNMGWTVAKSHECAADIATADFPSIRRFRVARKASAEPLDTVEGEWVVCSPQTVAGWTAVGFYFAREIFRQTQVPIGLLQASIGGTDIETWMSSEAINNSSSGMAVRSRWTELLETWPQRKAEYERSLIAWKESKLRAETSGEALAQTEPRTPLGPESGNQPSWYFQGMVLPVIPYAIRGVLWYQGENNAGRPSEYPDLQIALIRDWRKRWDNPALPFLFVQMPGMSSRNASGQGWALFREAQAEALTEPATAMAVTIDLGSNSAHSPYKREVGERLALLARANAYGETNVPTFPQVLSASSEGDKLVLNFDNGGFPLVLKEAGTPPPFEVAGKDGVFYPATFAMKDERIVLHSGAVSEPCQARYLWHNYPKPTLFNTSDLPAPPFSIVADMN